MSRTERDYSWTDTGRTKSTLQGHVGASEANFWDSVKDFNYAEYVPALTTAIGLISAEEDRRARSELLSSKLKNAEKSFGFQQNLQAQQLQDLDRILGDQMSASGLEALKAEGRLKAASAETGATGTSNLEAIQTAEVNKLHRDATLVKAADIRKGNALNSMVATRLGFTNTMESILSGRQSDLSAGLQTLNAGLSGFGSGVSYLGDANQAKLFGITNE